MDPSELDVHQIAQYINYHALRIPTLLHDRAPTELAAFEVRMLNKHVQALLAFAAVSHPQLTPIRLMPDEGLEPPE